MTMTCGMKCHEMEAERDALLEGRPFNMNCCASGFHSSGPLCSSKDYHEATIGIIMMRNDHEQSEIFTNNLGISDYHA